MSLIRARAATIAAIALGATTLATTAGVASGAPAIAPVHVVRAAIAPIAAAPTAERQPAVRIVTLPTGDRFALRTGDDRTTRPVAVGVPSGGGAQIMQLADRSYVFPRSVLPLIGSVLDPELFNTSVIAARPDGRIPVTITLPSASGAATVPGVEITTRKGRTATGFITPASSRSLGAGLDKAKAKALYAAGTKIRATSVAPTKRPADQRAPLHTLTIRTLGPDGRPVSTNVAAMNLDDPRQWATFGTTDAQGLLKMSVPAGTYTVFTSYFDETANKGYLVSAPDFDVHRATTSTVDLRTATRRVTTSVFKPIGQAYADTTLSRAVADDQDSHTFYLSMGAFMTTPMMVAPTRGRLHGRQWLSQLVAAPSPDGVRSPYSLTLFNVHQGRVPDAPVRFVTTQADTTVAKTVLHGPPDLSRAAFFTDFNRDGTGGSVFYRPQARKLTRYLSAGAGVLSGSQYFSVLDFDTGDSVGFQADPLKPRPRGGTWPDPWLAAPMHSRFISSDLGPGPLPCSTCVKDRVISLVSLPMSDSNPAHHGQPDFAGGRLLAHYAILADGRTVAGGEGYLGGAPVTLPTGTKVVTGRHSATRGGPPFATRTTTVTEFSSPLRAAIPVQRGLVCAMGAGCTMLPMLSADYRADVDVDNRLRAGRQSITITVHQAGRRAPVGITAVKAWMSYDGRTWTAVPVTGSGADYAAAIQVPRAQPGRATAGLRVRVTDRAGSTLTETMKGAFLLPR